MTDDRQRPNERGSAAHMMVADDGLRPGYRAVALTVSVSIFMQFLDSTALTIAIPAMALDLAVAPLDMNIAILSYQLALVAFIPLGAVTSRWLGPRRAFALSLLIFLIGSVLCAMSTSLAALVAARTLQGAGGAVMMPIGRLLVVRSAAKNELIKAMNWLLVPGIIGPLLGPAVGGFMVTYSSWQWIFLINVPIALLGIAGTFAFVSDVREETSDRFDLVGVLLVSPALVGFVLGLERLAGSQDIGLPALLLGGSMLLSLAYIRHARRTAAPVLDLSLLAIPTFRLSLLSGGLIRTIFIACGFLLPLWFQLGMRMSAAQAGIILMMTWVGALLSRFAGGTLLQHLHPRSVALFSVTVIAALMFLTAFLQPNWPLPIVCVLVGGQGLALMLAVMVIGPVAFVEVAPARAAAATAFYTTVQQLSMPLGVTAAVWTVSAIGGLDGAGATENSTYAGSFVILGIAAAIAFVITARLDPISTAALSPRKKASVA